MDNQTGVSVYGPASSEQSQTLRSGRLTAEYSTGRTPTGDYFALGTIRGDEDAPLRPAWVIIGTGLSEEDAIRHLTRELEHQAQRFQLS